MLKVFSIQKAFSGFSSLIPSLFSSTSPHKSPIQANRHFSNPPLPFAPSLKVMPPKADLLISL